jgi:Mrp family chromosome partitioning ATPase
MRGNKTSTLRAAVRHGPELSDCVIIACCTPFTRQLVAQRIRGLLERLDSPYDLIAYHLPPLLAPNEARIAQSFSGIGLDRADRRLSCQHSSHVICPTTRV